MGETAETEAATVFGASGRASRWDALFSVDLRWLGVFRVALGGLLCAELLRRVPHLRAFYTNEGVLPNHFSLFRPVHPDVFSIYHIASSLNEVRAAFVLTLCVFICFAVGYRTRLTHALSALLVTSLHSRNLLLENPGSVALNVFAVLSLTLPLGRALSVDALIGSLEAVPESNGPDLAKRAHRLSAEPVLRLAALVWALHVGLFFASNGARKWFGSWRDGSGLRALLHQDGLSTWVGARIAEGASDTWMRWGAEAYAATEIAVGVLVVVPLWSGVLRRLSFVLACVLALASAICTSASWPAAWLVPILFLPLFGATERAWARAWFGGAARRRMVIYDQDCGFCLLCCRILARLDPCGVLTFIGNETSESIPDAVDRSRLDASVVVVDADGGVHYESAAVRQALRAIPCGVVLAMPWWLPGADPVYRFIASRRMRLSEMLGFGACGLRPTAPSAPPGLWRSRSPFERDADRVGVALGSGIAVGLLCIAGIEVVRTQGGPGTPGLEQPEWAERWIRATRTYRGWGWLPGDIGLVSSHLVVDGRTRAGDKLDPLTGREPDFDPMSRPIESMSPLWVDYQRAILRAGHEPYRPILRDFFTRYEVSAGEPLAAFDVWMVSSRAPDTAGQQRKGLRPLLLVSHRRVRDSGAAKWRPPTGDWGG